ncbi:hypothetical protein FOE78_13530 [Microlunatus elymi]|uniref:CAAX protease self-immunity n=2 Tax=Microlunatus elymi TaxID=2596828 RepID=A0A516Q5S8_9ACTN|nr:hypothetical protein FOE78_13530 [Microlunatus elymi]
MIIAACWLCLNGVVLLLGSGHLPFRASSLAEPPTAQTLLRPNLMLLEVFGLMVVVRLMTRHRTVPDLAGRAPDRSRAARETFALLGYGVLAQLGGLVVGRSLGWHAFGFHLDGMVIRTGQPVVPAEAIGWSVYNLICYALIPLIIFRRRYSTTQLGLRSSDRRADLRLIVVILVLESAVQLLTASQSVLDLDPRQILLGAPLTFALCFAGTVAPTMIFVYAILLPRYLKLTGSLPATVALGGLTYAGLHVMDGWTNFATASDAVLSLLFAILFYGGPGMFKAYITIRTANAWTHVWAYHAIAPHTLLDTPMFVRIFGIR